MAVNLLDIVTKELSGENAGKIAAFLGESSSSVTGSIGPAAASVIAGLMSRASAHDGAQDIFSRINSGGYTGDFLKRFSGMLAGKSGTDDLLKTGSDLLSFLFGSKLGNLETVVSSATGLAKGSSSSMLAMLAPLIMGILGKQTADENLDSAGVVKLLDSQKDFVQSAAPAALSNVLGLASLSQLGGLPPSATIGIPGNIPAFLKGLWPFLLGIAAILLLLKTCNQTPVKETPPPAAIAVPDTTAAAPDTAAVAAPDSANALGAFAEYELPNGVKLNIPEFGIERKLIAFIEDATKPADKETWFSFDRLVFDTGKATLKPESQEQINNINEILKAFPAVTLKFGGYTDNVGNPQANLKLSQERAETVMAEIVKLGIDKARLAAEGYGDQHPVADNATEEGRQKNRRVDCRVAKK
jgi:outer membrane protein OmpA-like peptidoglycan-associated protein